MNRQIIPAETLDLVPVGADKYARYRLGKFVAWMVARGRAWHDVDLKAYRDHLLGAGKAPATVAAHLSTVRGRYRAMVADNGARDILYELAGQKLQELGQADAPANRKALVDELLTRLENAIDPQAAPVKTRSRQDRADADQLRLTAEQASALMAAPGLGNLQGARDTAVIALMLCTGIREAEMAAVDVGDLRQRLGGELALHVREGKGRKERLIPYGELSWVLAIVEHWQNRAGIRAGESGVFRGLYRGGERARPGRLSVRAIQYILASYPVVVDGELVTARPHDLRRTYARRLYDAGVDVVAIQQNLGHVNIKTTLSYIGALDASQRRAPSVYSFDLAALFKQGEMDLG